MRIMVYFEKKNYLERKQGIRGLLKQQLDNRFCGSFAFSNNFKTYVQKFCVACWRCRCSRQEASNWFFWRRDIRRNYSPWNCKKSHRKCPLWSQLRSGRNKRPTQTTERPSHRKEDKLPKSKQTKSDTPRILQGTRRLLKRVRMIYWPGNCKNS